MYLYVEFIPTQPLSLLQGAPPDALKAVEAICGGDLEAVRSQGFPDACHLGPSVCSHVYRKAILGLAGDLSAQQVDTLRACLPGNIQLAMEENGIVVKSEDERLFRLSNALFKPQNSHYGSEQRRGVGGRRHLRDGAQPPLVEPPFDFEENAAVDGGAIDTWKLSQGVEMDLPVEKTQELSPYLWNLDRIDQENLPLNGTYNYGNVGDPGLGEGVTIYVIDSGIMADHQEFTRPDGSSRVSNGWNFLDNSTDAGDVDGHGSHVAGIAAGLQVGVAKGASLVSVRILDECGLGTVSDTLAALDWVAANQRRPCLVSMSLGVPTGQYSRAMEAAVKSLVVDQNITVRAVILHED